MGGQQPQDAHEGVRIHAAGFCESVRSLRRDRDAVGDAELRQHADAAHQKQVRAERAEEGAGRVGHKMARIFSIT